MTRDFILLEALQTYSVEESKQWLGRIVRYYRKPVAGYTPTESRILKTEPYEETQYANVKVLTSQLSSTKMKADFLGLFGFNLEYMKTNSQQLASHHVQRLRIHNDDDVLARVLDNADVVKKLDQWGFGIMKPAFMVVGLLVAENILYHEHDFDKIDTGGNVDPAKIAAAITGVPPVPALSETPISLSSENTDKVNKSMTAIGRRVFAIEYRILQRRIDFKLWDPISSETTKLNVSGPQGDRAFSSTTRSNLPAGDLSSKKVRTGDASMVDSPEDERIEKGSNQPQASFIADSLDEVIDEDDKVAYFTFDG